MTGKKHSKSAMLLVFALALGGLLALSACAADEEPKDDADTQGPLSVSDEPIEPSLLGISSPAFKPFVPEEPDYDTLYAELDADEAERLIELSKTNADANWIAANAGVYAAYQEWAQKKLLKLAADDPLALAYVRSFGEKGYVDEPDPDAPALSTAPPSRDVPDTNIPHFYQWDLRWGNTIYNNGSFGMAGCAPTSLSMVYQGLTGKKDISPLEMGQRIENAGYTVLGTGTSSSAFAGLAPELGLECWSVDVSGDSIVETLSEGYPIIASVGIGYFSSEGHYFVLAGLSADNKVILNDPYSATRSSELWDPDFIASQCNGLFAFAPAES